MSWIAVGRNRGAKMRFRSQDRLGLMMTNSRQVSTGPVEAASDDRLESWKEIAAYMRRDVKTVQRWEKREAMPVHRHLHDKMGSSLSRGFDIRAFDLAPDAREIVVEQVQEQSDIVLLERPR